VTEDEYGNDMDGDEITFCCFPDCGCDGARLCMAKHGASEAAHKANVEGMYSRKDFYAQRAKFRLLEMCIKRDRNTDTTERSPPT
jgi:hypothetical protein